MVKSKKSTKSLHPTLHWISKRKVFSSHGLHKRTANSFIYGSRWIWAYIQMMRSTCRSDRKMMLSTAVFSCIIMLSTCRSGRKMMLSTALFSCIIMLNTCRSDRKMMLSTAVFSCIIMLNTCSSDPK